MNKKNKGFTLVELLVVIAIIAILVVLILVALGVARQKARDSQRKTDLRSIQTALELYASDNGTYPADQATVYSTTIMDKYLKPMPTDPLNLNQTAGHYGYIASSDKKDYILCATLEQPASTGQDPYAVGTLATESGQPAACKDKIGH